MLLGYNRIAIIDDAKENRLYLSRLLSDRYVVDLFESPDQVDFSLYSVFIIDLVLTTTDGVKVGQAISSSSGYKGEPIIIVTSYPNAKSKITAYDSGVTDYIDRFVTDEEILSIISCRYFDFMKTIPIITNGNLVLDKKSLTCEVNSVMIDLEVDEFKLLRDILECNQSFYSKTINPSVLSSLKLKISAWSLVISGPAGDLKLSPR